MSLFTSIKHLVKDPPPPYIFELSEAGIVYVAAGNPGFQAFAPGTLVPSPLQDNLLNAEAAARTLEQIAPVNGNKRRRPAAVILPDYAVRVTLLDFDTLPSAAEEAQALVRFRVKKSVPFDMDSAAVSYWVQPAVSGRKKVDVVAVIISLEILARYEALFRTAQFHAGEITTSTLSALELFREQGVAVIAKLAGLVLTVAVVADGRLRLFRCLALDEPTEEEIRTVLQPTFAFVEDELGRPVDKLVTCGLPEVHGLPVAAELLQSRLGPVTAYNAGLLGYLEAAGN